MTHIETELTYMATRAQRFFNRTYKRYHNEEELDSENSLLILGLQGMIFTLISNYLQLIPKEFRNDFILHLCSQFHKSEDKCQSSKS